MAAATQATPSGQVVMFISSLLADTSRTLAGFELDLMVHLGELAVRSLCFDTHPKVSAPIILTEGAICSRLSTHEAPIRAAIEPQRNPQIQTVP